MITPADAALAALTAEGESGKGAEWPERSCVSLIRALCRALGLPEPAYEPWEALSERAAGRKAIQEFKCMGAGHQHGLVSTGHWTAVDVDDDHPQPGDVLSWDGPVLAKNGEQYDPACPEAQMTGICGVYGYRWVWTPRGLSPVHTPRRVAYITRSIQCR